MKENFWNRVQECEEKESMEDIREKHWLKGKTIFIMFVLGIVLNVPCSIGGLIYYVQGFHNGCLVLLIIAVIISLILFILLSIILVDKDFDFD